jgi:hypothetical protein
VVAPARGQLDEIASVHRHQYRAHAPGEVEDRPVGGLSPEDSDLDRSLGGMTGRFGEADERLAAAFVKQQVQAPFDPCALAGGRA